VLRRGEVTLRDTLTGQSPRSLSRAMIGGELPRTTASDVVPGDVLVSASGQSASFEIRAGEIAGVAAIDGNGQRELLRAIAGVDDAAWIGAQLDVTGPVAFVPDDRINEGLIGSFSLTENLLLGSLDHSDRWLDWNALRRRTEELIHGNDVRAPGADVAARTLSGGNQQKFILARAFEGAPRVVVAEDPTRGLDVLATQAIHERLRAAARAGAAVVFHSSDIDEVLSLASRLFVVARGAVRELPIGTSRDAVGDAMLALEPAG
jgi:simple sugar transport system ATP-binding protein